MTEKDIHHLLDIGRGEELAFDRADTLVDIFRRQAQKSPDAVAVVFKDRKLTYREVDEMTDRLAAHIMKRYEVGPEEAVGVMIERSELMLIYPMAVMKAGAAYMPLDHHFPADRLQYMCEDAGVRLILSEDDRVSKAIPDFSGNVMTAGEIAGLSALDLKRPEISPKNRYVILYTSGTTGKPKGVELEHHNIVNFCHWYVKEFRLLPNDHVSAYASFGFDAHMLDMYPALSTGASVYIIPSEMRLDLPAMNRYMEENNITVAFLTTQIGHLLASTMDNRSLRLLSVGGEKLMPVKKPRYELYNVYGPTECTLFSTFYKITEDYDSSLIGRPLANYKLYVVDQDMKLVKKGDEGELVIAGEGVGRGYLHPAQKDEGKFTTLFGEPCYRSGDLVRWSDDDNIEYIGRIDGQVKLRGFRIETGEIESRAATFEGIGQVAAVVKKKNGNDILCLYYTVKAPAVSIDTEELKAHLSASLTEYMIPQLFIGLDKMPLNTNGKIDRKNLPDPEGSVAAGSEEMVAAQNETQEKMLAIAKEVTGRSEIGITTDLFDAGMSSIACIRFCVMMSEAFGKNIGVSDVFEKRTVSSLEELINEKGEEEVYEIRDEYPLSQTQMGIFIESERYEKTTIYNLPQLFRFKEKVDTVRLRKAVEDTVRAHPVLLMGIVRKDDGEVVAKRRDDYPFEVEIIKSDSLPDESELAYPFDLLSGECLCRAKIFDTQNGVYLFLDTHHIVSDGVSIMILLRDIGRCYEGQSVPVERYTGFEAALDEEKALSGERFTRAKKWHDGIFEGCGGETYPLKDGHATEDKIGAFRFYGKTDAGKVRSFCAENNLTENALYTAAFGLALKYYTASEQAVFSTIYDGRNDPRLADSVSMFVKTLPMLLEDKPERSVCELIKDCRDLLVSAMANDLFGFVQVRRAYDIKGDIMFAFQGDELLNPETELCGIPTEWRTLALSQTMAAISVEIFVEDNALNIVCEYDPALYSEYTVRGLAKLMDRIAGQFTEKEKIADLSLVSREEEDAILQLHDTKAYVAERPAYRLLQDSAHSFPDRTALIAVDRTLTYTELNEEANALGHILREHGVGPDTIVGVLADRNSYAYVMRQGVLKSGGAFMPLDPAYPDERIDYIMENSRSRIIVTTDEIIERRKELIASLEAKGCTVIDVKDAVKKGGRDDINAEVPYGSLAYVIYTSGTTGKPKGVMLTNKNLVNYADGNEKNYETLAYTKKAGINIDIAAFTFDVSITEEFVPFAHGMTNVLATKDQFMDAQIMRDLIIENHVDVMNCTPTYILNMLEIPDFAPAIKALKSIDVGAEAFPPVLYSKLHSINPGLYIVNTYGPTECTVSCTLKEVKDENDITIGVPLANVKMATLDHEGRLLPNGALGELLIMGDGVGRGYVGNEELTKKSFITMLGLPAYRSGDLVRIREDGDIEYHGRMDDQVKLRGLRVELGEIENVMETYPGIDACKVIVVHGETDYLAAYFTADEKTDIQKLKEHLASYLTEYMVPQAFMQLDRMPLTASGKVNKKELPEIKPDNVREYVKPEGELECMFAEAFAKVLNCEKVGALDNFFEIGGTSINAIRVVMEAGRHNVKIVFKDLFDYNTPRALASFVRQKDAEPAKAVTPEDKPKTAENPYERFEKILKANTLEAFRRGGSNPVGDVLLTGATGYLGIHILHELLVNHNGHIYCPIRTSGNKDALTRLKEYYYYYFGEDHFEDLENRVSVFAAQITEPGALDDMPGGLMVINCAANVKHFSQANDIETANTDSVRVLVDFCVRTGSRLIHVSTTSIAGYSVDGIPSPDVRLSEQDFWIGQNTRENRYVHSKFMAEELVLDAITNNGLKAKIMRLGNLSARLNDGEFQVNFNSNNSMSYLRTFALLGVVPYDKLDEEIEFSPVDEVAHTILVLSQTPDECIIFHPYNTHSHNLADIINGFAEAGINISYVEDDEFEKVLERAMEKPELSMMLRPLMAYDTDDAHEILEMSAVNTYTAQVLYRLGYRWPVTAQDYVARFVEVLKRSGFFDVS